MGRIWIDTQIHTTPPQSEGRLKKEMDTYALLDRLNMPFFRLDHGAAATVDDCLEVERLLDISICTNLFLCNSRKTDFYMLMMPGEKRYQASELAAQIQSTRLSFAHACYMERFLDISPGSVSVLGLMNDENHDVELLIDRELMAQEFIGCHPCVNTTSLKLRMKDLFEKFLPYTGHQPRFVTL